jgi:hypothetical protein
MHSRHSVARDQHLSAAELLYIARREASIMEAALPPVVALLLGAFGVISTQVAVWAAFALGLLVLAAQGVTVAASSGWVRSGRSPSWPATSASACYWSG